MLPYCWRDETPLSNHELRMDDDVYQSRQDPALTVGVRLETGELALIWTTTPWTLPSNLAIAVGPGHRLRRRRSPGAGRRWTGERVVLAAVTPGRLRRASSARRHRRRDGQGRDLAGRRVHPAVRLLRRPRDTAHHVLLGDFVTTEDGTGLVHLAPAFGEDDMVVVRRRRHRARRAGRRRRASFTTEVPDYVGPAGLRRQPADHRGPQGRHRPAGPRRRGRSAPSSCATRRTSTPTRTAGAAGTRSSTRPSPAGSCA